MPKIIATKKQWVKLGYRTFAQHGVKGIVIEKMAAKLKVNKSSFYWHFKTKQRFIDEIISHWVSVDTDKIILAIARENSAKKKFNTLIEVVFKQDPNLDFIFFLKRYGNKNKKIQALIDEIDQQRIDFTTSLFIEMGTTAKDAKIQAKLFYKYLIGYHEMIRYKQQNKNYVKAVKKDLRLFIKI